MDTKTYLVTPTNILHLFLLASDREYFSNPIAVEPLYCELSTKFIVVRDPHRGVTYPTQSKYLFGEHRLSDRQRKAVAAR